MSPQSAASSSPAPPPDTPPAKPRGRRWLLALAIVVLVAAALAWWRLRGSSETGPADEGPRPTPVVAVPATAGDMPVSLGALGTVSARNTATVRAQVTGQLEKLYFQEGQTVKAGQLLAQIDPRPFQVQLDSAKAQLAKDEAQLAAAEVDLKRYRTLLSQDSIAAQQVDTQAATVEQLKATVAADRAAVAQARLQLDYARVTAPIGGRVGLKQVDVGNLVQSSDTNGIVLITEVQPINVVFTLPQQQLPAVLERVASGATLPVEAWDGGNQQRLAEGRLVSVDNQVDLATGTVKLKAEFANDDGRLFPNQFVNVRLQLNLLKEAVLAPAAAVQQGANGPYVFVVKSDDTVTMRPVKPGPGDGRMVSIASGLQAGERVVTDGVDRLREGSRVQAMDQREVPVAAQRAERRGGHRRAAAAASGASAPESSASRPAGSLPMPDAPLPSSPRSKSTP